MPVLSAAAIATVSGGSLAFRSQKFFTNDCCSSNSSPLQHVNFPRSKRGFLLSPKVSLSIDNNDAIGNHAADSVDGQQSLSPDPEIKPTRSVDWEAAKTYAERSLIYKGKVTGFNSGGLLVRFYSLVGFLPFPQLSPNHWCKEPQKTIQEIARGLTGSFIYVKVIRFDEDKKQLVLSERQASWTKYSNQINVGDVLQGRVGLIEDYGAFVHILFPDGSYHLTGLVHVSEVSWDFVRDVRDILTKGDDVRVKIINLDRKKSRLNLSIKQLEEDPLLETLEKVIPKRSSSDTNSLDSNSSFVIEPLPGLETIIEELMREDGIYDVTISRQGFEKRVVSQDLQLWLSNAPATGDQCTLLARAGRQVQEVQLTTSLDQVGIKRALQRVLERVP